MLPRAPGKENIWRDGWGKKRGKRKILGMFCEKATMLGTEQAGEGGRKKMERHPPRGRERAERDGGGKKGSSHRAQPGLCTLTPCSDVLYRI